MNVNTRMVLGALTVAVSGLTLVGCTTSGSPGADAAPTTTSSAPSESSAPGEGASGDGAPQQDAGDSGVAACQAAEAAMAVTVTDFPADGEVLYTLQLTHQGSAECVLDGASELELLAENGSPVDAELGMDPASAEPITLSPGGTATMTVGWGVEPAAGVCTDAVSRIRAQLSDGQAEADIPWDGEVGLQQVCSPGTTSPWTAG
jgi:Protein of unknown function (DUF4232)